MWKPELWHGEILQITTQLVHMRFHYQEGLELMVSIVYERGMRVERRDLWNDLMALAPSSTNHCWVVVGDFNEIVNPLERRG